MSAPLLEISDLRVDYDTEQGAVHALRGVDLVANQGEVIGIVGESGCGKSTLASALIMLMGANATITGGSVRLRGEDILSLSEAGRRKLRGAEIAMVFQDPMTSLSPVVTIGDQMIDYQHQSRRARSDRRARALAMLNEVGIPDAEACLSRYPHELSGGMRQRVAVAAALLMEPAVLVADEPTTALDVTMEAQILHLFRRLRQDHDGAIIVVTHHLGVIGELCDRVYVMYAGQVVEEATVDAIYHAPRHPYTRALIDCDPAHFEGTGEPLPTIPGRPPDLETPPSGCAFADRCPVAVEKCATVRPPRVRISDSQTALCHLAQP